MVSGVLTIGKAMSDSRSNGEDRYIGGRFLNKWLRYFGGPTPHNIPDKDVMWLHLRRGGGVCFMQRI